MDADGSAYFLYHSIGQYPGKADDLAAAMAGFAQSWGRADDRQWEYALGKRAAFLGHWQTLIGAAEGTVTGTENVTVSLNALIGALPSGALRGRTVLVAADCFPSMHFLLTGLAPRFGFTLATVPLRQGAAWVEDEDMLDAWGPDVALALLTWVSSTSSHRSDIARLAAHGRARGSLVGIDITQAAGLLPFDVTAPEVDFAISTSLKWMCGTPGAGMLYVAPPLISECEPEVRGWFSQPDPFSWDLDAFAYAPDIRRFDTGTPGTVAAIASLPAMEWLMRQDRAALLAHNRSLSARILEGVDRIGLPLVSPRDEEARGGSIMVAMPGSVPAGGVVTAFREAGIAADARGQTLRLSPGAMTRGAGVDRMLEVLAASV